MGAPGGGGDQMNKIKSWIRKQWQLLQLRYLWAQLGQNERLEWFRDLRYLVWRQEMDPAKISPFHKKNNNEATK
jgi:hypothetical protein